MPRFVSPFTPRSQYGGALSNLMTAAFADSDEGSGSRRPEYASERSLREAQARAQAAKAALDEQTARGRSDLSAAITRHLTAADAKRTRPLDLSYAQSQDDSLGLKMDEFDPQTLFPSDEPTVRALGQGDPGPALQFDDLDAPMPPSVPLGEQANLSMTGSAPALPDIQIGHGAPGPLSRQDQMLLDAGILEAFGLASTSSNPASYADAFGKLQSQGNERAFLGGDISGSDLATTLGKDVVGAGEGVLYNKFDMNEPYIQLPGDPTKGGEWTTGLNPNARNRRERVRLTPGGIPQWSGVETPEPTALIQQYGGPIPAVKESTGTGVFIQPDRTGGAPVEVKGYVPPPTAAQTKRDEENKSGVADWKNVDDSITEMQEIIRTNPVSTASLLAPIVRAYESLLATGAAVWGAEEVPVTDTPGIRIQSMKEGLVMQMGMSRGKMTKDDAIRLDRAMGILSSGTPANAHAGLETMRQLNDKYNKGGKTPSGDMQGGPVRIKSDAEYRALPSGTVFLAPDGSTRRKP